MTTVHVFDIDTTIADNTHRAELVTRLCVVCLTPKAHAHRSPCTTCNMDTRSHTSQEDWDKFFDPELMILDTPIVKAQEYISMLRARGSHINFVTGRTETSREVTKEWLTKHFNYEEPDLLILRPVSEEGLNASTYKERALSRLAEQRGYDLAKDTFIFYEDDSHVFQMYQKHGIVIQCPEAWDFLMPAIPKYAEVPFGKL